VLLACRGDLVVVVSARAVLLALLHELVLEQGLEGLVLRLLLGVVADRVGMGSDLLEQITLRIGQLGAAFFIAGTSVALIATAVLLVAMLQYPHQD
jgi:hypothetical protein